MCDSSATVSLRDPNGWNYMDIQTNLLTGIADFRSPDAASNIRDVDYYIGNSAQEIRELL